MRLLATKPTCTGDGTIVTSCTLTFVADTGGTLPKYNPSQLVEATLGANQDKVPPPTDGSITSFLYPTQADFDVSYVNQAYLAATMGPVDNDQSGYVGSPTKPGNFTPLLNTFQSQNTWPRFIDLDGTKSPISKLPSPLELIPRLSNPKVRAYRYLPRADELAYHRVDAYPGTFGQIGPPMGVRRTQSVTHSAAGYTTFCDAILDVRDIIHDNYVQYKTLMDDGTCTGGTGEMFRKTPI